MNNGITPWRPDGSLQGMNTADAGSVIAGTVPIKPASSGLHDTPTEHRRGGPPAACARAA